MENLKEELNNTKVQSRSLPKILHYLANNICQSLIKLCFLQVSPCTCMCVSIKQWLLSVSISTLTTCVFLCQGSLSERRRSIKTEVSFALLFFCVCVGFGMLSLFVGSKCPCSLVLLWKTIRSAQGSVCRKPRKPVGPAKPVNLYRITELHTPETSCVRVCYGFAGSKTFRDLRETSATGAGNSRLRLIWFVLVTEYSFIYSL